MPNRVAINGLGRIGRAALKLAVEAPQLELVAVNEIGSLDNMVYLLRYDSVYGRYERQVDAVGQVIDRLAATDGGNPPVVEQRPRRRQGSAEHDPAGGDRRSGGPQAQTGVGGADAKVVIAAARTPGEGGEASRGHEVQHPRAAGGAQRDCTGRARRLR